MTSDRAHDGTGSATARFGRTLSTLRAVPAATSATTSASLHPAVAAEFGAQLSFHRAQAEDIRSRARDAAALRALLKKLRAQAEEVSSEYGRLGERTAGMNEAVAALLSHLYAEQRASIETMAVSGGDETSRPASFESSSLEADVSAALAHLELEGCGVSDAEPSSLADGVAKSAATPPVIRQRKRRSKEALMRAVAAYVQPSPASSRAVSPTQQQQQFKEISASDAANATLAVPPSAAESTLTSDDAGPSFDLEVLNYLLLVTHELQQHMVATCARTKREMSAELVDHLAEFTKGNLRDARDQSQVFFRAFAEYQSHVKGLNANVTQAAASQAERELEHAYQQQWTAATAATGSSVSPIPNTGASVAMLTPHMEAKHKLHQFKTSMSQTVNRLRGQDEQSEARKIQSGRAGVVETSERLNVIGDQCLAKFELADTALEITELPRILLSHVKSMRAIFEDGRVSRGCILCRLSNGSPLSRRTPQMRCASLRSRAGKHRRDAV